MEKNQDAQTRNDLQLKGREASVLLLKDNGSEDMAFVVGGCAWKISGGMAVAAGLLKQQLEAVWDSAERLFNLSLHCFHVCFDLVSSF